MEFVVVPYLVVNNEMQLIEVELQNSLLIILALAAYLQAIRAWLYLR